MQFRCLNIKTCVALTLTILPGKTRSTVTGECVDAILTGSAILTRHAGTVIDICYKATKQHLKAIKGLQITHKSNGFT